MGGSLSDVMSEATSAGIAGVPLYVVLASELNDRPPCAGFRGWHSAQLDLIMRASLKDRGLWRGRGPAVFVDDFMIEEDAIKAARTDDDVAKMALEGIAAVAIHETAHALENDYDLTAPTTAKTELAEQRTELGAALWEQYPSDLPSFFGHEMPLFGRMALHLHDRLWQMGFKVPLPYVFGHDQFYGYDPWPYRLALADEFKTLAGKSFATIRTTPAPKEFIDLWRQDVIASFHQNSEGRWGQVCLAELNKFKTENV